MANVNRAIETELLLDPRVNLTIIPRETPFPVDPGINIGPLVPHFKAVVRSEVQLHVRHAWPPNLSTPATGHIVLMQPWEYGWLPDAFVKAINKDFDEVWVPSTYVRDVYIASSVDPTRIHVIPNGVDTGLFKPRICEDCDSQRKAFTFLFVGGLLYRKGIDCLLRAYLRSFSRNDEVLLIVKEVPQYGMNRYRSIIEASQLNSESPRIKLISADLPESQMVELFNSCDCLLHPYRGEGFALPVLEAMSCGLPAIVTSGGATDDFVDETCGFLVPAVKRFFGKREIMGLPCTGDLWLMEPDVAQLGKIMLSVFLNRTNTKRLGVMARLRVEDKWTWKETAKLVVTRMQAIVKKKVVRFS